MSDVISIVCKDQWGRDKCIRTVGYLAKLLAAQKINEKTSLNVYRILSQVRVVTRFLDGLPLLLTRLRDGLGGNDGPLHHRVLTKIQNLADVVFYPLEHIAFLLDLKVLQSKRGSQAWWDWSCVCWGISLMCSLIREVERMLTTPIDSPAFREDSLLFVRDLFDFINAVGWMPAGFLWAYRLPSSTVAILAIVSSMLGLRRIVRMQRQKAKQG